MNFYHIKMAVNYLMSQSAFSSTTQLSPLPVPTVNDANGNAINLLDAPQLSGTVTGSKQFRWVHVQALMLCLALLVSTHCGAQPATAPSTRPSVQSGGAEKGAPEVSVYVPADEWDLKARERFPIVVELSLPEHPPQEGQDATFETYDEYSKDWRDYPPAAHNPRTKDSYLRLTFEPKDSDGVQQSLYINGELLGKSFRIAGGSTFEKTVVTRIMVQGDVTMTLRAYCYISGVFIGASEPHAVKITNSQEDYREWSPRRGSDGGSSTAR